MPRIGAATHGLRHAQQSRTREQRGSVLVEFAIVTPLLLLLVFGIIEYATLFNADSNVAHSTRAGGRTGAISSIDPQMEFKAAQAAANALNISPSSITGSPTVCVGRFNATSSDPCGDLSVRLTLVHTGLPGSPNWQVQVPGFLPGQYPPADNWPVASRNYGCPTGSGISTFDDVVVHTEIRHDLVVPGLFAAFLGGNSPRVSSTSTFQLEPVPSSSC